MSWNFGLDFGSALGGFVGLMASNASSRRQYKYQSKLQEQAAQLNYDYGIKSLQNSPSAQRQGLESAGYNPMLAVGNATSGANAGWTTTGQAASFDSSQGITSGFNNALSLQNTKNQTSQTESINDRNYAEADNLKTLSAINAAKLPYVSEREKKEIANVEAQSAKLENDIHYQNEMLNYYENSLKLQQMGLEPQIINAGANATNAKTNRLQYMIDKEVQDIIRDKEKRYKEWGNKHPYLRNIDESITRYFNGFGATASKSSVSKR